MKNKILLSCLSFALIGFSGCELIDDLRDELKKDMPRTFTVRVENVSTPGLLDTDRANGTVPLSPGAFAVYKGANPMFMLGHRPDEGTARIAEDGFPMKKAISLKNNSAVSMSGTFDSPGGPDMGPALFAGESATFTITAKPGDKLQFQNMFVQSNDWFYGFGDQGLELFNGSTPISGNVTGKLVLYDAGSELDTAPGTGPFQKPVQDPMATDVGPDDTVHHITMAMKRHTNFTIPANASVIKVTVTPQ
ncbi:hypothetical protein BH24BAC1_BH24BAC1_33520 [soil metagenome]